MLPSNTCIIQNRPEDLMYVLQFIWNRMDSLVNDANITSYATTKIDSISNLKAYVEKCNKTSSNLSNL